MVNGMAWCKDNLIALLLVLLLVLEGSTALVSVRENVPTLIEQGTEMEIQKISQISDARIDTLGASVVVPTSLPRVLWLFLLLAYIALLVFNFSYTFRTVTSPQWFWESLYTVLTLGAWYVLDPFMVHLWFPLALVKSGLIVFILYLYLLERRPGTDLSLQKPEKML
jgi:hypothetical protein